MKMNDGQKKIVVSDTMLRVFLIVSVCILVIVGILYSNKMYVDFLNNVEPWIECFVGVLLVVVGGVYVNTKYVKSRKGGTKYYKFEYRKPELEKNLSAYCDKFSESKKMRAIKHIHQWVSDEKTRNNYWNTVFYLQDIDGEFIKAWNDFNFYENKLLKKEADLDYYILVKNYIYIKVYYTYKKILKKSI